MLLFSCFLSWSKETDNSITSTGKIIGNDTTVVVLPIDVIREANIKLTERLILKDLNMYKDEEIKNYQNLVDEQTKTINNLRNDKLVTEIELEHIKTSKYIWKATAIVEAIAIFTLSMCLISN